MAADPAAQQVQLAIEDNDAAAAGDGAEAVPQDDRALAEQANAEIMAMRSQFASKVFSTAVVYLSMIAGTLIAISALIHSPYSRFMANLLDGLAGTLGVSVVAACWARFTSIDLTAFRPSRQWRIVCTCAWLVVLVAAVGVWWLTRQLLVIITILASGMLAYVFTVVFILHSQIIFGGRMVEVPLGEDYADEALMLTSEVLANYICLQVLIATSQALNFH